MTNASFTKSTAAQGDASTLENLTAHASTKPLLVIMAGGTGGHVFPGLAVANEIVQQGWRVEWFGTADKMEAQVVPKNGFKIHFISVKGVRGKGIAAKVFAPFMLLSAVWQARKLLKQLQPNAVLGMGGFASGPGGIAAWSLGIPIVIHEQNAVFGMTNRWLAKVAKRVLCGFDIQASAMAAKSPEHVEFVGNPVRSAFFNVHKSERSNDTFRILIVGGSLGALALNQIVPKVLTQLRQKYTIKVVHQAGKGKAEPVLLEYAKCAQLDMVKAQVSAVQSASDNINHNSASHTSANHTSAPRDASDSVIEFIDDIPAEFANADIVICRAGALTVAEVAATASCAIFVPLPIAVDDHQTYNARSLSDNNAALLIQQDKLAETLYSQLDKLLSKPENITEMGRKARALCIQDATLKVTSAIVQEGLRETL